MYANLITYNVRMHNTKSTSVELSGNPDDVIQLTIGEHKYTFNIFGNLVEETRVEGRINISIGNNSCATVPNYYIPTEFKSKD